MVSKAALAGSPSAIKLGEIQDLPDAAADDSDSFSFWDLFGFSYGARTATAASGAKLGAGIGELIKNPPDVSVDDSSKTGIDTACGADRKLLKLATKEEVIKMAKDNFAKFDLDGDGFLAERELGKQVEDPKNKGLMAQTIAAIYGAYSKLDLSLDDDAPFAGFAGLTKQDLDKVQEVIADKQGSPSENPYGAKFLESADKDCNGKLSIEELKELAGHNLPEDVKTLVDFFIENQDPLDDVEITDVLHHYFSNKYGDKADVMLSKMDFLMRKCWENQIEPSSLYAEGKPNDGVSMYGVQQGIIGDCYFESQLAAIADKSPELIKQMIKDNKDGTYTVTFPGDKDEPITVTAPTEAELGLYNGSSEYGQWGSIIEKAYGAYCHENFTRRTPLNMTGGLTTTEGADGGGVFSGKLMKLLTGESADVDWQWCTFNSTTKRKLLEHVGGENKVPVVAWQKPFKNSGHTTVSNHVYSVLDFDPKGEDGGTVTLYNPWGHKEEITFKKFSRRFLTVTYSDK